MLQSRALISADLAFLDQHRPMPLLATLAVRVAVTSSKWATRYRTRLALKDLDAHLLRDIGVTQETASIEANKRFWRA
ncbi:DUF1127 domain-containing protein [Planktotalea sp.]|jgi:uncharacterized protein YjiS (DUF1127 family)|uniref:DUF1127 domain-containing protein n=1 Tax=Planktotalea sp. TaxID=2029877 RepID=UPI0002D8B423